MEKNIRILNLPSKVEREQVQLREAQQPLARGRRESIIPVSDSEHAHVDLRIVEKVL